MAIALSALKIVTLISEDECIGDSLDTINNNFANLDILIATLSANVFGNITYTKTVYTANGLQTTYSVENTISLNASNYRVDLNGVLQEPTTDYFVIANTASSVNIVFTTPPANGTKIVIVNTNTEV